MNTRNATKSNPNKFIRNLFIPFFLRCLVRSSNVNIISHEGCRPHCFNQMLPAYSSIMTSHYCRYMGTWFIYTKTPFLVDFETLRFHVCIISTKDNFMFDICTLQSIFVKLQSSNQCFLNCHQWAQWKITYLHNSLQLTSKQHLAKRCFSNWLGCFWHPHTQLLKDFCWCLASRVR